ncbi:hypothetical protein CPB84DRAFT_1849220 [Gymnopilus junonius]|uniref:Alpha/beta-hydrolase n=1 Tax=Gymnopilus junonius TaxID=109634 RepID=A0A9P5NI96_GYMJU|nr:hypothetical protein CPB84DRAFT_1849220 [Gymnopilus junonius]
MSRPRTKEIIELAFPCLKGAQGISLRLPGFSGRADSRSLVQLDVYYPPNAPEALTAPPILVFFYGGGFTLGSPSPPPSFITTLAHSSRLKGSEDVIVFIMGHSAGGVHLAGVLFTPGLFSRASPAIRGVVFLGILMTIPASRPQFYPAAITYYDSPKAISRNQPLRLLQRCTQEIASGLPPIRALAAGSEPRYILTGMHVFAEELRKKGGVIEEFVLEGHDHLSPVLALCSGNGEEWDLDIVKWISTILQGFGPY